LLKEETNVIKLGAQHGRTNILNANSFKICWWHYFINRIRKSLLVENPKILHRLHKIPALELFWGNLVQSVPSHSKINCNVIGKSVPRSPLHISDEILIWVYIFLLYVISSSFSSNFIILRILNYKPIHWVIFSDFLF
jgi:hypothetical protein